MHTPRIQQAFYFEQQQKNTRTPIGTERSVDAPFTFISLQNLLFVNNKESFNENLT